MKAIRQLQINNKRHQKKVKAVLTLLDKCKYDTNLSKGNYQCKYGCSKFIETIVRLYFYQDSCFAFNFEIMKETKKQIKAQIINEISTKYSKKIKELEEDKRRAIDSWSRLVEKILYCKQKTFDSKKNLKNAKIGIVDFKSLWI